MLIKAMIATTEIGPDRVQLSKSALEGMASDMTNGTWALPSNVEHDPSVPPIGKTLQGEVETIGSGKFGLVVTTEFFSEPTVVELPNGEIGFRQISKVDSRPFRPSSNESPHNFVVTIGHEGFASIEDESEFQVIVSQYPGFLIGRMHFRRALTPDPLLTIILPAWFLITLTNRILTGLSERLGDRIADDLANVYDVVRNGAITLSKNVYNRNRLVTYVITILGEPEIEFVAQLLHPQILGAALTIDSLSNPIQRAIEFSKTMEAAKVQFILTESGNWQFNFLTTSKGEVIGTEASFSKQVRRIDMLKESHPELHSLVSESWNHWNQMKQDRTDGQISENVSNDSP